MIEHIKRFLFGACLLTGALSIAGIVIFLASHNSALLYAVAFIGISYALGWVVRPD